MRFAAVCFFVAIPFLSFSQKIKPEKIARIPEVIRESSGIAVADSGAIWTVNDGGNPAEIYLLDAGGMILSSFHDSLLQNDDWEDLAEDSNRLYVGDFGNNNQRRRNLSIFILNRNGSSLSSSLEKIDFRYPDQVEFPPPSSNWNFDCEAFFHSGDSLYLLSKNLSNPNSGFSKLYRLPDTPGNYTANVIDSFYFNEPVTSADISSDRKTVIVLTYFSIWRFTGFQGNNFLTGKAERFPLKGFSQKEAVCFINDDKIFLSDERHFGKGGKLYSIDLNHLKRTSLHTSILKKMIYNAFNNPKRAYRRQMKKMIIYI